MSGKRDFIMALRFYYLLPFVLCKLTDFLVPDMFIFFSLLTKLNKRKKNEERETKPIVKEKMATESLKMFLLNFIVYSNNQKRNLIEIFVSISIADLLYSATLYKIK